MKWTLEGVFEETNKNGEEEHQKLNKSNLNYEHAPKPRIPFKNTLKKEELFPCRIRNSSYITKQNLDIHVSTKHEGKSC